MLALRNFMQARRVNLGVWAPLLWAMIAISSIVSDASRVAAQQDVSLMDMPAAYTDVIDAFDGADVWDVNVRAGFSRVSRSGTIQREALAAEGGGEPTTRYVDVATHSRVTNSLQLGLDVGVYKDLAVYGMLPVVLRDSRELSLPGTRAQAEVEATLADPAPGAVDPAQDTQLFRLPFKAPPRSGIPAVHLGIAWAPTNQYRTRELPTWVLMLETRIATADVVSACDLSRACVDPGVGDGTSAVRMESRTSYRFRYLEPYMGFAAELRWVSTGSALFGSDFDGLVQRQPPRTGEITLGTSIIPWEDRERFQRVAIDLRLTGAYVSEGRDVTPLFDAFGTSRNPYLSAPNYDRLVPIEQNPTAVHMTGVTDSSAHARISFQAGTVIQAAKYIRFTLGFGLGYATPYALTGTDACNPNVDVDGPNDPRRSLCPAGILNPAHRPVIDLAGKRFRLDGETTFELYSSATAQF